MAINSPINITSDITNQCSGLCSLSFYFSDSVCSVIKDGAGAIKATYVEESGKLGTKYNGDTYKVDKIVIYNKSLHRYNGRRTDAEMLIHLSDSSNSSKKLIISIPIESQSSSGAEIQPNGAIVSAIIKTIPSSTQGIKTATQSDLLAVKFNSTNNTYNLNYLIPSQQPFYTYVGNPLYERSGDITRYVVFPRGSAIYVSANTIEHLNKITTPFELPISGVPKNGSATYNPDGANASETGDVYIECSPAGEEGVILYQTTKDGSAAAAAKTGGTSGDASFTNVVEQDWFVLGIQIIFYGFIGIIVVFAGYKLLMVMSPAEKSASSGGGGIGGGSGRR